MTIQLFCNTGLAAAPICLTTYLNVPQFDTAWGQIKFYSPKSTLRNACNSMCFFTVAYLQTYQETIKCML